MAGSRFAMNPTVEQQAVLKYFAGKPTELISFAYAELRHEMLRQRFIDSYQLKQRKGGHVCTYRLKGSRQCGCYSRRSYRPLDIPNGDHLSEWMRGGRTVAILSQPYGMSYDGLQATLAFCKEHGLSVLIDTYPSFHYPGHVLSLLFTRLGEPLERCK